MAFACAEEPDAFSEPCSHATPPTIAPPLDALPLADGAELLFEVAPDGVLLSEPQAVSASAPAMAIAASDPYRVTFTVESLS
ncbi:MAG: hypothetical protein ACTHOD_17345 [Motilibacteraceae bacterium]